MKIIYNILKSFDVTIDASCNLRLSQFMVVASVCVVKINGD